MKQNKNNTLGKAVEKPTRAGALNPKGTQIICY